MLLGCQVKSNLVRLCSLVCLSGSLQQLVFMRLITICLLPNQCLMRVSVILVDLGNSLFSSQDLLAMVSLEFGDVVVMVLGCFCSLNGHLLDELLEVQVLPDQTFFLDSMRF